MNSLLVLPVREVSIFGDKVVVPNDTACEVFVNPKCALVEHRAKEIRCTAFQASVSVTIALYHTHFPEHTRRFTFLVFESVVLDQAWIKRRQYPGGLDRTNIPTPSAKRVFAKKVRIRKIASVLYSGFLRGKINRDDIKDLLPKSIK